MKSLKYWTKRILSYSKSTWDFEDYPIETWKNPNAGEDKVKYGAGIIGWLIVGHGRTIEEAIEALHQNFNLFKKNNTTLPRPGTKIPLQFASTNKIDNYEDLAVDFFKRVLEIDFFEGFYSDESTLDLFASEYSETDIAAKKEIIKKTFEIYNVDITGVYSEPLWKVFEKIKGSP